MTDLSMPARTLLVFGLVVIVGIALRLAAIDWREHRLPDQLTLSLTGFVAVWVLSLGVVSDDIGQGFRALGWGVAAFLVFLVLSFAGMGGGDVKFSAPLGATLGWFGWSSISTGLMGLAFSAGLVAMVLLARGKGAKHKIAYGPYMAFGLLCGIAQGLVG